VSPDESGTPGGGGQSAGYAGSPMRIVSLLPSATEIVFALGLGDELVGRTHECDYPPEAASVPVVTSNVLPVGRHSREIHDRVAASLHGGSSIYRLDREALADARADLVLTQELCQVCAVSYREVGRAVRALRSTASVVSLEPSSIEGIFNTISTVGAMAEAEDEAVGLVEILRERLAQIENRVLERRLAGVAPRRVVCLEWIDPPFAAGHWVPEQVRRAGGWELLGLPGERSAQATWEQVREVDPEQLLLMPCGFDAERAAQEWQRAETPSWLRELSAVEAGEVYALDGSSYFSRPGPRVVEGIALLAEIFDPAGFSAEAPAGSWLPLGVGA
jgi:iron complex transport system substrate-binding protein